MNRRYAMLIGIVMVITNVAFLPAQTYPPQTKTREALEQEDHRSVVLDGKTYVLVVKLVGCSWIYLGEIYRVEADEASLVTRFYIGQTHWYDPHQITSFVEYKGDLYIGGTFKGIDAVEGTEDMARWDGVAWRPANDSLGAITALNEHRGEPIGGLCTFNPPPPRPKRTAVPDDAHETIESADLK